MNGSVTSCWVSQHATCLAALDIWEGSVMTGHEYHEQFTWTQMQCSQKRAITHPKLRPQLPPETATFPLSLPFKSLV